MPRRYSPLRLLGCLETVRRRRSGYLRAPAGIATLAMRATTAAVAAAVIAEIVVLTGEPHLAAPSTLAVTLPLASRGVASQSSHNSRHAPLRPVQDPSHPTKPNPVEGKLNRIQPTGRPARSCGNMTETMVQDGGLRGTVLPRAVRGKPGRRDADVHEIVHVSVGVDRECGLWA